MTRKLKKITGIIVVILVLTTLSATMGNPAEQVDEQAEQTKQTKETDTLILLNKALSKSGINWEGFTVTGWAELPKRNYNDQEVNELKRQLNSSLKVVQPKTEVSIQVRQVEVQSDLGCKQGYVTVSLTGSKELQGKRALLEKAFGTLDLEPQVLTVVRGTVAGRLSQEGQVALLQRIFGGLAAYQTEGMDSEELVSITGFTPLLPDELDLATGKVNVNAAARYSSSRGKTLIYLGTPLISTEY